MDAVDKYVLERDAAIKLIDHDICMRMFNEGPMLDGTEYGKRLQLLSKLFRMEYLHNATTR